jgi:peptidoglycan-associated lipoprotein
MRRYLLLLVPSTLFAACAHEQPVAEAPSAPPVVAQPAPPEPTATKQAQEDDTTTLRRILSGPIAHFDFDKAQLTSEDRQKLQALGAVLKTHPAGRIRIAGNCDERGTEEYNLMLGQRRADVAKRYLVDLGIDSSRVETISYGENRPIAPGHDEAAYSANRRDDAEVISSR